MQDVSKSVAEIPRPQTQVDRLISRNVVGSSQDFRRSIVLSRDGLPQEDAQMADHKKRVMDVLAQLGMPKKNAATIDHEASAEFDVRPPKHSQSPRIGKISPQLRQDNKRAMATSQASLATAVLVSNTSFENSNNYGALVRPRMSNANPRFGRIQTRQKLKRPIVLNYNQSMFDRVSDSVSTLPEPRGPSRPGTILNRQSSASVTGSNTNNRAQNRDDTPVDYADKSQLVQHRDQQARKRKQLRELRALASISQHSPTSTVVLGGPRRSSVNKEDEGKQQHHYGLTHALWPKQTSTQWMTAGRSSMPDNTAPREDVRSTGLRRSYKAQLYGDIPNRKLGSPSPANSRGRASLDPYEAQAQRQSAKLNSNKEKQKFKTIQHFFPKQGNERPNQNGWIGRDAQPSFLYAGSDKRSMGPSGGRSDTSSAGPRRLHKAEAPTAWDRNMNSSQSSLKSGGRVKMIGRMSLEGKPY